MNEIFNGCLILMLFLGVPIIACGICKMLGLEKVVNDFAVKHGFDLGLWTEKEPEGVGAPTGNEF